MRPDVSVITPVYNSIAYVCQAIQSVVNQKGNILLEHILVDDCSTDGSRELLHDLQLKYKHVKVIFLTVNSGPINARNIGIDSATGKFLAFLDSDDEWMPEKCVRQISFMNSTGIAMSYTDYRFMSSDGFFVGPIVKGMNSINWIAHHATRGALGCLTVMINRDIVSDFKFINTNPLANRAEDFIAWAAIMKKYGSAGRVPFDLARYRVVKNSRSSNVYLKAKSLWIIYTKIHNIPYYMAIPLYILFAINSTIKRFTKSPKISRATIDGFIL